MSQKLVSVITPCYNGGKYIHRLLDSILFQTYPRIEMFIIDDGSTDDSDDIIKEYISRFNEKGYKLKYIYQKNQGQSAAINSGLKYVKGEYLVWPDVDDFYASPEVISQMVEALERRGSNTSMVRVQLNVLNEDGEVLSKVGISPESRYKTDLFEDCLFKYGDGFWGAAGGYMAKVGKIDSNIPNREIYTERHAGQNWQICLPLLYQQQCITIEKNLYNVVAYDDSHSRNVVTNNDRQKIYYRTIKNTLSKIPLSKDYRKYLMKKVRKMTQLSQTQPYGRRYRTYVKRFIKGVLPYGLIMFYKRRRR